MVLPINLQIPFNLLFKRKNHPIYSCILSHSKTPPYLSSLILQQSWNHVNFMHFKDKKKLSLYTKSHGWDEDWFPFIFTLFHQQGNIGGTILHPTIHHVSEPPRVSFLESYSVQCKSSSGFSSNFEGSPPLPQYHPSFPKRMNSIDGLASSHSVWWTVDGLPLRWLLLPTPRIPQ